MHKTKNLHEKIVIFSLKKRLLFFSIRSGQLSYFDTHFCGAESNNDTKTIFVFSFIIKTKKFTPKLHISHLINGWCWVFLALCLMLYLCICVFLYLYFCICAFDTWEYHFWYTWTILFSKIYYMLGLSGTLSYAVFVYLCVCVFVYLYLGWEGLY